MSPAIIPVGPGGEVKAHAHLTYSEHFPVVEGSVASATCSARATICSRHAWSNPTAERAVAVIEVRPGHPGFETTLRVGYGLARDGLTLKDGTPRNPLHLALLLHRSEIRLPGVGRLLAGSLALLARLAIRRGVDLELQRRYARAPSRP